MRTLARLQKSIAHTWRAVLQNVFVLPDYNQSHSPPIVDFISLPPAHLPPRCGLRVSTTPLAESPAMVDFTLLER
jgi:hypothetical protein